MKTDIDQEVAEWFAWLEGSVSGGLGYPKSCDFKRGGSSAVKHIPTPRDFPKRLRQCDRVMKGLFRAERGLYDVLMYCSLVTGDGVTDTHRAGLMGISIHEFLGRKKDARRWVEIGYQLAHTMDVNLEMV